MFEIDLAKIKKYDKPGPRYTSYPTAPHFNEDFTYENYLDEVIKTNYGAGLPDLSLYFHLPFCDTLCYFCGSISQPFSESSLKSFVPFAGKEDLM